MTPLAIAQSGRHVFVDVALDYDKLEDLRSSIGGAALGALLDLMLQDIPPRVGVILTALASSQPRLAASQAHALRGAASGIGAQGLADACRAIERLDHAGPSPMRFAWIAEQACAGLRRVRDQVSTSTSSD